MHELFKCNKLACGVVMSTFLLSLSLRQALQTCCLLAQIHWPDRYVPLFGASGYDVANEREAIPFEEQLRGLEAVIKAGKVRTPCD